MSRDVRMRLAADPRFKELASKRKRFSLILSIIVLSAYYSFMILVAFAPSVLGKPIVEGSVTSIGVPIGVVIIIGSWLLTGLYVYRANTEFDATNTQLLQEAIK